MVAIQETKFNKKDSLQTSDHFIHVADSGARCFWSDTTSPVFNERHGVGLILSSASPFGEVEDLTALVYKDQLRNRYLLLKTSLGTSTVFLHVIYAPDEPPRRGDFFRALPVGFNWNGAEGENDSKHIVLGDFNVTMDNFLDQASPSQLHPGAGREEMCDWLDALGLLDAWRFVNPDTRDYTSPTRKNRLDYCFLTANLLEVHLASINHVRDQKWHNEDHIPVAFRLQAKILPNLKRAPWRCPPWLLRDFEVVQYLRESVEHLASRLRLFQGSNPGCLLDEHKRADCIYLRRRWLELRCADSRDMALRVLAVNDALDLYNTTLTDCDKSALEQAQADLKAFRATIHDRNTASKFAADLHLSERSSRHFFRAPQQDCLRSPITEFQDDDGSVTEDPIKIGDGHRKFWGGLFQSTSPDLQHLRNASYQPIRLAEKLRATVTKLSAAQQSMLDAPITANDLYWAIMKSANGKAPGPDGLPIEYYKLAPHLWAQIYEVIHDNQLSKGKMTKFQRRAHLSLLYKTGDRSKPGNYRPLTLLNHDAKLGPKILAYRLGKVLPTLIHEDQSGFVPNRSIRHSLIRFQDLQELCRTKYPNACAVLIDFAKAFDSVLWPALDMVLQHFGFGVTFRTWIKTFYHQTSVSLLLNNSPGVPFLLGSGVRQGDPLSPGLFVVFMEPLMNYLRVKFSDKGLVLDGLSKPHLLMAFADDCTGLLSDVDYAQDFLTLVQDYAAASGLRLNVHKTSIMPFTRQIDRAKLDRLRLTTSLKVLTPTETVVLLGVLQGASVTAKQRFSDTISKLRARCAIWKYRARTLRGKVVLLQNIILPIMWYTASVTCVPASVLQTVEIIIRNFVHSKDTNSVNAAVGKFDKAWIYASVATGGLGLTPTKIFVQAMHLKTLRDALAAIYASNQSPRWVTPALHLFTKAMSSLGAGFDILYAPIKGHQWTDLPDFWRSTLRIWATQHMIHESTVWKRYSQVMPIWYNRYFTFGKAGTPLAEVSKSTIGSLKALGVNRLQDFLEFHGGFATKELLYTLLPSSVFARPASRTRLVNDTLARLNLITPPIGPIYGPFRPPAIECATHAWAFGDQLVINMTNRDFVQLLLKARSCKTIPDLRLDHLQLSGVVPPADTWKFELRFDRHVLPVCSDLKFRLQHNALGFRYKFRWRTEVATSTTCVHGCSAIEDARHLFWTCNVAEHQWGIFLLPFKEFVIGNIDWKMIVFPGLIKLTPTTLLLFGAYAVHATFTIVRCCILRALWLHRNKRLYNPELATAPDFVRHHAWAYMQLHLHQLRKHATSQGITRRIRLIDKVEIGLRTNFSG